MTGVPFRYIMAKFDKNMKNDFLNTDEFYDEDEFFDEAEGEYEEFYETEFDEEATFPSNHVMRGTKVMEGHGICRVFAVGDKTENGKVFEAAQIDDSVKTPLNEQLDGLSDLITNLSYLKALETRIYV